MALSPCRSEAAFCAKVFAFLCAKYKFPGARPVRKRYNASGAGAPESGCVMANKRCEIICVGTELLLGDILNTNAQFLAQGLSELGLDLYVQTVVGDNEIRLEQAVFDAMRRADILLFTGGLGPTADDLTKEVVSRCFHRALRMDPDALAEIHGYYRLTRRPMPLSNEKQALLPEGGLMLKNPQGTAPGCVLFSDLGHIAVLMPGPDGGEHQIVFRMVDGMHLRAWEKSPERAALMRKADEFVVAERVVRTVGVEEWFGLSGRAEPKRSLWSHVVTDVLWVYPVAIVTSLYVAPAIARLSMEVRVVVTTLFITAVMRLAVGPMRSRLRSRRTL